MIGNLGMKGLLRKRDYCQKKLVT